MAQFNPTSPSDKSNEHEGFHDYTIATPFERLIATVESALRNILTKDIPRLIQLQSSSSTIHPARTAFVSRLHQKLPFRGDTYSLVLQLPSLRLPFPTEHHHGSGSSTKTSRQLWRLGDQPHSLQEWFLQGPGVVLFPDSYSGRILQEDEAHTLLSAGITALNHLQLPWPMYIPVHDALRDAYRGIAMKPNGAVVRFEADSIHGSSLPMDLESITTQFTLLASRLQGDAPTASRFCSDIAEMIGDVVHHDGLGVYNDTFLRTHSINNSSSSSSIAITAGDQYAGVWAARQTHILPLFCAGHTVNPDILTSTWDAVSSWQPWADHDDPLACLHIDALWHYHLPEDSHKLVKDQLLLQQRLRVMEAETTTHQSARGRSYRGAKTSSGNPASMPLNTAHAWRVAALRRGYLPDAGQRPLILLQAVDNQRQFLRLQSITVADPPSAPLSPPSDCLPSSDASFYSMLCMLWERRNFFYAAHDVAELSIDDWWLDQGEYVPPVPPSHDLQDAVRDVFDAPFLPVWPGHHTAVDVPAPFSAPLPTGQGTASMVGKTAPLNSLISRLALQVMKMNNPRATALLWMRFVRELRFSYWDMMVSLPRMTHEAPVPSHQTLNPKHNAESPGSESDEGEYGERPADSSKGAFYYIDHSVCIIHQKLQMLELCIQASILAKRRHRSHGVDDWQDDELGDGMSSDYQSMDGDKYSDGDDGVGDLTQGDKKDFPFWVERLLNSVERQSPASDSTPVFLRTRRRQKWKESDHLASPAGIFDPGNNNDVPLGVALQSTLRMPSNTSCRINIPERQQPPPCTEDTLLERAALTAAKAAGYYNDDDDDTDTDDGIQLWAHTHGALLLSDMQAFKAANPNCQFTDFLAWHSSGENVQYNEGEFIEKVKKKGEAEKTRVPVDENMKAWCILWEAALPIPALEQKSVFQPALEGERVLHFLESMSPAAVHAELLAVGLSAAVQLLEGSRAATLPSVATQLDALREIARATGIRDGTGEGKEHSMHTMKTLLDTFGCVEHTVVAAESLLQRLSPLTPQHIATHTIDDARHALPAEHAVRIANDLIVNAFSQGNAHRYGTIVDITRSEFDYIQRGCQDVKDHIESIVADDSIVRHGNDIAIVSEWCIEISKRKGENLIHKGTSEHTDDHNNVNGKDDDYDYAGSYCYEDDTTDTEVFERNPVPGTQNEHLPSSTIKEITNAPKGAINELADDSVFLMPTVPLVLQRHKIPVHRLFIRRVPFELRVATTITNERP